MQFLMAYYRNIIVKTKRGFARWRYLSLPVMLLAAVGFMLAGQFEARSAPQESGNTPPVVLTLRADTTKQIRAFSNGMPLFSSLGGFFEFYRTDLLFRRTRVAAGPWEGLLKSRLLTRSKSTYSLAGVDAGSGATSNIDFRQTDSNILELTFSFKAPDQATHLSFEITKLAADLCRNAALVSFPTSLTDAATIPLKPLALGNHILLRNKNKVIIRTPLSDLEITDLQNHKTILVSDSRNAPWDRKKSISVSAEGIPVTPGKIYMFKYKVRLLPPATGVVTRSDVAPEASINTSVIGKKLGIPPKEETKASGNFPLKQSDTIYGSITGSAESELQRDLQRLTGHRLPVKSISSGRGIVIERDSLKGRLPAEGFEIVVSPGRIIIKGADARGCLFGVYALTSRLVRNGGEWKVPCGSIRDWPDMSVRGMCLELLPPSVHDISLMKRYLSALSRSRCNLVIFLHNPRQMLSWQKKKDDGGWSKKEIQEIAAYARSLHMDVWGGMGSGFDSASFPGMNIMPKANIYDPQNNASYDSLFSLYSEIIQTYKPSALMISHDEMSGLNLYARKSSRTTAEIFAADVNRIHDWLAARGVKTAMWGDMLLDFQVWDTKLGNANSQNPPFNSGATHHAIDKIVKEVMILDWHYGNHPEYRSIEYFRSRGFTVFGCPWYDPNAATSLAKSVKAFKGSGVIGTDWGFWRTLSPSATTIYTLLGGWSTTLTVDRQDADVTALADMLRDDLFLKTPAKQTTVNLAGVVNRSTWDINPGDGKGLFGLGPVLDLRSLPSGKQDLGGIIFELLPTDRGVASNAVVVENSIHGSVNNLIQSKQIALGGQLAKSLAFLHTAFVEEPQFDLRKLGHYAIEYEGGRKVKVDLMENYTITDVRSSEGLRNNAWSFTRSPDVLAGSLLAWRGFSSVGAPLNLQLFVWRNPYPELKINRIRLIAADDPSGTSLVLLGLTILND